MTARILEASNEASSEKPIHLAYRPDIDGLRAFAVLIVVVFHAFETLLPGGFIGVDIFFVISGYLISSIIFKNMERGTFSFVDFYVRRIKRILPVLIVVLATCYLYGWFKMFPAEFMALGKHIAAGSVFGSNFALWQEAGYFDAASTTKPLLHLWSLAIEEQFYLLWPVLALITFRARVSFLWINIAVLVVSFVVCIHLIDEDLTAAFYSPVSRFWEIGIGSLVAWLTFNHAKSYGLIMRKPGLPNVLSVTGALLLIFALLYFDGSLPFPGYWALIPVAGTAMLILAGPQSVVNRRVLGCKPAVQIGLISYPIYLWHWPLLTALNLDSNVFLDHHRFAAKIFIVAMSILLGWLSYLLVEQPIKRLRSETPLAVLILTGLLATGALGLFTNLKEGISSRIPENLRELGSITNVYAYFNFADAVRQHTCHISMKMPDDFKRPSACFSDKRPLLMLWGDSYAAALYPGIHVLAQQGGFGIEQVTVGNSPPFFDERKLAADNKTLAEDNNYALTQARLTKPDVIVLSWMVSGMNAISTPDESVKAFGRTIALIKDASPNSRVILIGPVPQWDNTLSQTVVNYLKTQPMGTPMVEYSSFGLRPEPKIWDKYFSEQIPKLGVRYISAYDAMCTDSGCLTNVGPKNSDLTAVDSGHLTKSGSEYLLSKVGAMILGELRKNTDGVVGQ